MHFASLSVIFALVLGGEVQTSDDVCERNEDGDVTCVEPTAASNTRLVRLDGKEVTLGATWLYRRVAFAIYSWTCAHTIVFLSL